MFELTTATTSEPRKKTLLSHSDITVSLACIVWHKSTLFKCFSKAESNVLQRAQQCRTISVLTSLNVSRTMLLESESLSLS